MVENFLGFGCAKLPSVPVGRSKHHSGRFDDIISAHDRLAVLAHCRHWGSDRQQLKRTKAQTSSPVRSVFTPPLVGIRPWISGPISPLPLYPRAHGHPKKIINGAVNPRARAPDAVVGIRLAGGFVVVVAVLGVL